MLRYRRNALDRTQEGKLGCSTKTWPSSRLSGRPRSFRALASAPAPRHARPAKKGPAFACLKPRVEEAGSNPLRSHVESSVKVPSEAGLSSLLGAL